MKKSLIKTISILFLIVSFFEIYAAITQNRSLEIIFKPLIATVLVSLYIVSVKKVNFWYVSALFFSFWGDVLLLFPEDYFILGLVSFLIAHIMYIKILYPYVSKMNIKAKLFSFVVFLIYFSGIIFLIQENVGELLIPVLVYGVAISVFGTVSLLNYLNKKTVGNLWILIGALLFIFSDSLIAINKFYMTEKSLAYAIMVTYIIAQYYICKGIIEKSNQNIESNA